jgi:hypothetical protein
VFVLDHPEVLAPYRLFDDDPAWRLQRSFAQVFSALSASTQTRLRAFWLAGAAARGRVVVPSLSRERDQTHDPADVLAPRDEHQEDDGGQRHPTSAAT